MSLTLASDSSWLTVTKDWDKLPELVAIWTAADGAGHCYCYCSEPPAVSSAVDRYGMCAKRMKVCDWNSTEAVAMRAGFGVRKSLSRWALGYRVPQYTLSLHRSSMQMSLPFSSHLFTSLHISSHSMRNDWVIPSPRSPRSSAGVTTSSLTLPGKVADWSAAHPTVGMPIMSMRKLYCKPENVTLTCNCIDLHSRHIPRKCNPNWGVKSILMKAMRRTDNGSPGCHMLSYPLHVR